MNLEILDFADSFLGEEPTSEESASEVEGAASSSLWNRWRRLRCFEEGDEEEEEEEEEEES